MKVNQMFIVCNDFVSAKHNIYHLKCDLVLICFRIKFEHFVHDVFLVMHNHLTFITFHVFNENKKFTQIYVAKI